MNRQPYCKPPQWWAPKLTPSWVRFSRGYRWRQLRIGQQICEIDVQNAEVIQDAVAAGKGVLITPNHSAHYDSAALYIAADRIDQPLYFMTAWQVFGMSTMFQRWAMQRMGCFSIDREGNDRQAFKQAIQVLQSEPHPLVIFPEGDIYHTTDFVTPFREGAAAIALSAAKRGDREVVIVPCGIKFWYVDDPMPQLLELTTQLEERLYLRFAADLSLPDRIHRLAEAALALKELDYSGQTNKGRVRDRIQSLIETILNRILQRHNATLDGNTPERVKYLRQKIIDLMDPEKNDSLDPHERELLAAELEDLFFVMQLFSYRGDSLLNKPSIERLAETLDKFEEDIVGLDLPTVRGRRRVVLRFGDPIDAPAGKQPREKISEMTGIMQQSVQSLIDSLNQEHS